MVFYFMFFLKFLGSYKEKLERFYQMKENCKKLEFIINFNMKNVDEVIIPNLKEIILKINEIKKVMAQVQNMQVKVVEEEDELLNELNGLQMDFRGKIRNLYENEVFSVIFYEFLNEILSFFHLFFLIVFFH